MASLAQSHRDALHVHRSRRPPTLSLPWRRLPNCCVFRLAHGNVPRRRTNSQNGLSTPAPNVRPVKPKPTPKTAAQKGKGNQKGAPAAGTKGGKDKEKPKYHSPKIVNGRYIENKRGAKLCSAFQLGNCDVGGHPGTCPRNAGQAHQCNKCLQQAHGGDQGCNAVPKAKGSGKGTNNK